MSAAKTFATGLGLFAIVFAAAYGALWAFDQQRARQDKEPIILKTNTPALLPSQAAPGALPDFRVASDRILKSVVSIDTIIEGEWFNRRFTQPGGAGSGVVLTEDGFIVTNNHVVTLGGRRLADRIVVTFSDGKSNEARIVGRDPRSDLAVLKVERNDLTPIQLGDSDATEVGQWAIAAGNPLGFAQTISVGVISSKGRPLATGDYAIFVDGIQTDAAINQGNSGGALCDAQGRLIGINTMIASTNNGNIGIGFAIPVNRVKKVVDEIIQFGRARYGRVGIAVRRDSSVLQLPRARAELRRLTNSPAEPPTQGVLIQEVFPGGPAAAANIRPLDIITEINGQPMRTTEDYQVFMSDRKPGDVLQIRIWSAGQTRVARVTLDEATT